MDRIDAGSHGGGQQDRTEQQNGCTDIQHQTNHEQDEIGEQKHCDLAAAKQRHEVSDKAGDIIDRKQEGERSGRADQKTDGRCLTGGLAESRENAARTQPVTEAEKQRVKRRKCCGLRGGDDADADADHHDDAKTEGRYGGDGRAPSLRSRGARQSIDAAHAEMDRYR
ncbi:hypothetical protein D3C86_1340270 [compost metagenome]